MIIRINDFSQGQTSLIRASGGQWPPAATAHLVQATETAFSGPCGPTEAEGLDKPCRPLQDLVSPRACLGCIPRRFSKTCVIFAASAVDVHPGSECVSKLEVQ